MSIAARITDVIGFAPDEKHGPLPLLLLIPTVVTGLVDAVSYLQFGHVFVANMTGNVVFLGFAVADAKDFSVSASATAIAAFMFGAVAGGRLGASVAHRGRYLAIASCVKIALVGTALVLSLLTRGADDDLVRYALIILLALAMGLQNAMARRLGVPDLTTTVLTLTLTGLAADSPLARGKNPNPGRRMTATIAMFIGAAIGAVLVFHVGISAVLVLVLLLLIFNAVAAYRVSSSSGEWTLSH
jgi:uncharacterized membrane protein YoaK (UPF0700 family)